MDADIPRLFALQDRCNVFETIIAGLYRTVLRAGDLAVDGGANRGLHAFPLAEIAGPAGRVLAFEPIAPHAAALARAARERGLHQLEVRAEALAEREGLAPFHWVRNADGYSGLRPRLYPVEPDTELLSVPTATIDGAIGAAEQRPWRFAKLDLEGGEFRALQGGARSLARHLPLLVFENDRASSARAYGYEAGEFFAFFEALGYRLTDLFGRPFGRAEWESPGYPYHFVGLHAAAAGGDHDRAEQALPGVIRRALADAPG